MLPPFWSEETGKRIEVGWNLLAGILSCTFAHSVSSTRHGPRWPTRFSTRIIQLSDLGDKVAAATG
jgi:hypothetical protein